MNGLPYDAPYPLIRFCQLPGCRRLADPPSLYCRKHRKQHHGKAEIKAALALAMPLARNRN